ncbi:hypothetical protein C8Q78DRAFT_1060998 [Trametes maxima]|nr:hypothetical protein C8Q78DRAFT_1060998 [Trametes maxima]
MPARAKRNASRRQQLPPQSVYSQSEPLDLLSFDQDDPPPPPHTAYNTHNPAVFEVEAPPSDPEVGRQSTVIHDNRITEHVPHEPLGYAQDMYGPAMSGSDLDDGPVSVSTSTSPPDPSPLRRYSIAHDAASPPAQTRSALSKLAVAEDTTDDDSSLTRSIGHIRSPVLAREPTTLESFSRTIRGYVPSSIPIPSAAPSPPRVSRPVSFGSFLSPAAAPALREHAHEEGEEEPRAETQAWKRRRSDVSAKDPRAQQWAGQYRGDRTSDREKDGERDRKQDRDRDRDRDMPVFSLDDDVPEDGNLRTTRYPGVGDTEDILWAGWDLLADGEHVKPRSVLMLGLPTGLQLWDCANLGAVAELLNLTGNQWGAVECARVLPGPDLRVRGVGEDAFGRKRPLIAFSSRTGNGTDFVVYSLRTHEVVKRLPLIGFTSFAASTQFIILSTSNPPTLHVLSACKLATLYTIPSEALAPFSYPAPAPSTFSAFSVKTNLNLNLNLNLNTNTDVATPSSSLDIDRDSRQPIYALSHRLLAYVAPISPPSVLPQPATLPGRGVAHTSAPAPAPPSRAGIGLGLGLAGVKQADIGSAAAKLGGSVLSGMRTLGGMAFEAARAGVEAAVAESRGGRTAGGSGGRGAGGGEGGGGLGSMFFSRSAPAATGSPHEYQSVQGKRRRSSRVSSPREGLGAFDALSTTDSSGSRVGDRALPPPPTSPVLPSTGCRVVVVDLRTLLAKPNSDSVPEPLAQFTFSRPDAISELRFSADGTALAASSRDGHAVRVLQLQPAPRGARALAQVPRAHDSADPGAMDTKDRDRDGVRRMSSSGESDAHLAESTRHMYTLRRGRTSAVVEGMEWAHDGLWFGMSTRKRTVHVFALNPGGGKPDGSSHMAGKVVNGQELVSTSTELSPLARVRLRPVSSEARSVPCAFTFVRPSEVVLPASLLPPTSVHFSASSSPSSVQSGGLSKPVSPAQRPTRPTNYKDLLVFDPTDGTLTLRRIFVERPPNDQAVVPGSIPVAGGMSISLPGMSTLSRSMGASPPSPRVVSGLTQMMERSTDIVGKESVVGTWSLARGRDWPEVRQPLRPARAGVERAGRVARSDWLSRAELSTFSPSPRILPRIIYLSHQFAFHILGEDYHALIRGSHLDVPSSKVEVRKPVEVSAFATGDSDAFVQGIASPHDIAGVGVPSSFDEPLASALAAPLHPLHPSPPVLPMLPNGTPGSASKSLLNAIPIRHVAAGIQDGMSEGFGRIRRELGKARSPRPNSDPAVPGLPSVPLEFDEEDEDFADGAHGDEDTDIISRSTSMGGGPAGDSGASGSGASVSTPSTTFNLEPLPAEPAHDSEGAWEGWGPEEQQAVEDAERFDDITVGFMDEEQETMNAMRAEAEAKKAKKRRGRRH